MVPLRVAVCLTVLAAACAVQTDGLRAARDSGAPADGGDPLTRVDGSSRDAGPAEAGPFDGGPRDSGARDSGATDAAPTDTGPPDAGLSDAGPPSCDALFGAAAEYIFCDEGDDFCRFNVRNDHVSCDDICASFGRACREAYDNPNDPGRECEQLDVDGCDDTSRGTEMCECARWP